MTRRFIATSEGSPSLIVELDGILATSSTFSDTVAYTDPAGTVRTIGALLGSSPTITDAPASYGVTFYDWEGVRVIVANGARASVAASAVNSGAVQISAEGGAFVGMQKSDAIAAGAVDVGEGPESLGIATREVVGLTSLTRPGQVGLDFIRLRFTGGGVSQIQSPASDYGDV